MVCQDTSLENTITMIVCIVKLRLFMAFAFDITYNKKILKKKFKYLYFVFA